MTPKAKPVKKGKKVAPPKLEKKTSISEYKPLMRYL